MTSTSLGSRFGSRWRSPAVDRALRGHWEGDLILGEGGRSAVGTLVERTTRLVLLSHLPGGRSAVNVEVAMLKTIATLPEELRRSITWDQGAEMSTHASFTTATGIPIYFCDPHSPWQRGSNENTNGLLRQDSPRSTDLAKHSATDLVAASATALARRSTFRVRAQAGTERQRTEDSAGGVRL